MHIDSDELPRDEVLDKPLYFKLKQMKNVYKKLNSLSLSDLKALVAETDKLLVVTDKKKGFGQIKK